MIIQKNGENKIFIDDNLNEIINIEYDDICYDISLNINKYEKRFQLILFNENIIMDYIELIRFNAKNDKIYFYNDSEYCICQKNIEDDEIISLSLDNENNRFKVINLNITKIPAFFFEDNFDDKYPKFEINISDCVYNMKIYLNDSEYIDIPKFQSHYTIYSTLEYITNLIHYLKESRPEFIELLCNNKSMTLNIKNKEGVKLNQGSLDYKIGQEGIYLTGGELEDYLVDWQKLFKLVMDGTWEVQF